jgi:hypothetical protein
VIAAGGIRWPLRVAGEVGKGAAEPVQRGDDEGVAGAQVVQGFPECFAFGILAGLLVGEDPCTSGGVERGELAVQALAAGRDTGVPDQRADRRGGFGGERVVA